jgi:hypothetical protein
MDSRSSPAAALSLALALALVACSEAEVPAPVAPTPVPPSESAAADLDEEPLVDLSLPPAEAGALLYQALECAGCHESAAVPGLVVIPLHDLDARFTEATLMAYLSAPQPPMPNFLLGEPERRALAVYLLATFD